MAVYTNRINNSYKQSTESGQHYTHIPPQSFNCQKKDLRIVLLKQTHTHTKQKQYAPKKGA
jgi:hypothetical protein